MFLPAWACKLSMAMPQSDAIIGDHIGLFINHTYVSNTLRYCRVPKYVGTYIRTSLNLKLMA